MIFIIQRLIIVFFILNKTSWDIMTYAGHDVHSVLQIVCID